MTPSGHPSRKVTFSLCQADARRGAASVGPAPDVYGKAGLARYKLNGTITIANVPNGSSAYSDNGTVFTWGAGVQAHIGIVGGRLEYEGFNKASTSVFSLSVFLDLK